MRDVRRELHSEAETRKGSAEPMIPLTCNKCKRSLAGGEPIWRICLGCGLGRDMFGRLRRGTRAFCRKCRIKNDRREYVTTKCETCGREVHNELNRRRRRHTFCCQACAIKAQSARARQRRTEARGASKPCTICGEHFEPTRKDSCYCSAACRQKAYRRRVTDRNCVSVNTIASRNAASDRPSS